MILFKDILTFSRLDYRDALLITLYLNIKNQYNQKSDESDNFNIQKSCQYLQTYGLSGNN